jgi:hypothetical protein
MQKTAIKTLVIIISFVALVGVACSFEINEGSDPTATSEVVVEPAEPTQTNTSEPVVMPTATTNPIPTNTTAPTTEEVVDEPPAYFTEEFDGDLSSWTYFMMHGDENNMDLYTDQGNLVFDLRGEEQYVYLLYDEYYYSEVMIEALAENRGKNTNNVSLICNYTDQYGWYEFSVSNGGMWVIWAYSEIDGGYAVLDSGGSTHVNMGKDSNYYTAVCVGNQLQLYINGYETASITDNRYNLSEGQVGVGVSSFDVTPIRVDFDYFAIMYP